MGLSVDYHSGACEQVAAAEVTDGVVLQDKRMVDGDFRTGEITDFSAVVNIKEAWRRIVDGAAHPSVFLTYEWIDAAWQWLRADAEPRLICCYRGDELVAVAPFCSRSQRRFKLEYRELSLIDIPDTQHCDIVSRSDLASAATSRILAHLGERRDWDVARLPKLEPASCARTEVADHCRALGLRYGEITNGENLEVDISDGWESYYATRSRRLKKGNNNIRNRIGSQASQVRLLWSRDRSDRDIQVGELLEDFKRISAASWKKETGLTLDQSGPGLFIDRLSEHAVENDWLSLWALELDGNVVATEYQLVRDGVVSALRADFDSEFADLSPGSYLNWQLLQKLCDTDLSLYRMGPGSNAYKLRWTNRTTELTELRVYNRTLRGRRQWLLETVIVPALRRALRTIRNSIKPDANSARQEK